MCQWEGNICPWSHPGVSHVPLHSHPCPITRYQSPTTKPTLFLVRQTMEIVWIHHAPKTVSLNPSLTDTAGLQDIGVSTTWSLILNHIYCSTCSSLSVLIHITVSITNHVPVPSLPVFAITLVPHRLKLFIIRYVQKSADKFAQRSDGFSWFPLCSERRKSFLHHARGRYFTFLGGFHI